MNIFTTQSGHESVSVVIVTHNRKELLANAIRAVSVQSVPVEIIVMDDASTDGTDEMVRADFADVVYRRSEVNRGPSYQRNEGARLATFDIVIFLDDDTIVQDPNTLERTLLDFDKPWIGAVTIPFINILQNNQVCNGLPAEKEIYIYHSFIGAAFAVRRHLFVSLGGFREDYFYMGEEGDFCLRLLNSGFFVRGGTCKPAFHYQPPDRVSYKADFYGRRNDILFFYLNSPRGRIPFFVLLTVAKGIIFGVKVRRLKTMSRGLIAGLTLLFVPDIRALKSPVNTQTFMRYRYIKKNEPISISQLLPHPPL